MTKITSTFTTKGLDPSDAGSVDSQSLRKSPVKISSQGRRALIADGSFRSVPDRPRLIPANADRIKIAIPPHAAIKLHDASFSANIKNKSRFTQVITVDVKEGQNGRVMRLIGKKGESTSLFNATNKDSDTLNIGQSRLNPLSGKNIYGSRAGFRQDKTKFLQSRLENNVAHEIKSKLPRGAGFTSQTNQRRLLSLKTAAKTLKGSQLLLSSVQSQRRRLELAVKKNPTEANKAEFAQIRKLEFITLSAIEKASNTFKNTKGPLNPITRVFNWTAGGSVLRTVQAKRSGLVLKGARITSNMVDTLRGTGSIEKPLTPQAKMARQKIMQNFNGKLEKGVQSANKTLLEVEAKQVNTREIKKDLSALIQAGRSNLVGSTGQLTDTGSTHSLSSLKGSLKEATKSLSDQMKDIRAMQVAKREVSKDLAAIKADLKVLKSIRSQKGALSSLVPEAQAQSVRQEVRDLDRQIARADQGVLRLGTVVSSVNERISEAKLDWRAAKNEVKDGKSHVKEFEGEMKAAMKDAKKISVASALDASDQSKGVSSQDLSGFSL